MKPGFYDDVSAMAYNADPCEEPSLSSTIARMLIYETPAHARYAHPRLTSDAKLVATDEMDLGSVAHEMLLGVGPGYEICPFDDYRTKNAREWRDLVIRGGKIPVKRDTVDAATSMVDAVRGRLAEIPAVSRAIYEGVPEMVAIWRDALGPLCRARPDCCNFFDDPPCIYDLKTTGTGLNDRALGSKIAGENTAYDMRAAFYLRGLEQLMPTLGKITFRWIFVEARPPFEVRIFEMDNATREFGERKAIAAITKWRDCLKENHWPGYPRMIERPPYPAWAEDSWIEREGIHL